MYKVTENGTHLATCRTERSAMIAVAKRIASDVTGRTLTITGPATVIDCRNDGFTIDYTEVAA